MSAATGFPPIVETLDVVLNPTHDAWIEEVRQLLLPAAALDAPVWERWLAVRYLNEKFLNRFRLERDLMAELRPLIAFEEMSVLEAGADRLTRLCLALDRVGRARGRGTSAEFATLIPEFLRALERWCLEIELTVGHRLSESLPTGAQRTLARMEAPSRQPLQLARC